jgi:nitrogen regulatory protein P-II 1
MLKAVMVVRPQRAEVLCQHLAAIDWIEDLSAAECRGYGRQKGHLDSYQGGEYQLDMLPKVVVSCFIPEERTDALIDVVCSTCRTGRIGDGKLFLLPVVRRMEG